MFHLKPKDEITFGNPFSDDNTYMYPTDHELLINGFLVTDLGGTSSNSSGRKQKGAAQSGSGEREDQLMKKAMHRDIERKRRQEMSQLYDNLRFLIPHHHLKGKRSISDLMNEAMSYTKHLEKNVEESRNKRDKLRGVLPASKIGSSSYVTVQIMEQDDGIEILINTRTCEFGLSRVMIELVARELDVVHSVSTKPENNRFLHKILAKTYDRRVVDISVLQERLTQVVNISLG